MFVLSAIFKIGALGNIRLNDDHGANSTYELKITETFLFSSLISAVDPVAVLAIFQEVGVNPDLYFLVFGESLLNGKLLIIFFLHYEKNTYLHSKKDF